MLKAKTLERLDAFLCLKKFAYYGYVPRLRLFTTASYKLEVLQAKKKKTAQSFLKQTRLIYSLIVERIRLKSLGLEEIVLQVCLNSSLECSFYRYVQSFTAHADAGEQIYLSFVNE